METKWTPGPWIVDEYSGSVVMENAVPNKRTFGYGCGNDFVADMNDGEYHEYCNAEEQNANAELIALAPEMAEAIMEWATMPNSKEDVEALEVKLNALAAKLRAIGGQS